MKCVTSVSATIAVCVSCAADTQHHVLLTQSCAADTSCHVLLKRGRAADTHCHVLLTQTQASNHSPGHSVRLKKLCLYNCTCIYTTVFNLTRSNFYRVTVPSVHCRVHTTIVLQYRLYIVLFTLLSCYSTVCTLPCSHYFRVTVLSAHCPVPTTIVLQPFTSLFVLHIHHVLIIFLLPRKTSHPQQIFTFNYTRPLSSHITPHFFNPRPITVHPSTSRSCKRFVTLPVCYGNVLAFRLCALLTQQCVAV